MSFLSIKHLYLIVVVATLFTTGCSLFNRKNNNEEDQVLLPSNKQAEKDPVIRPGVLLKIEVVSAGKAQVEVATKDVSAKGDILMPMIGAIACDGLTIHELQEKLVEAYAEYVHDPQVTVSFVYTAESVSPWGTVRVMGQVVRPGPVNIPPTRDLTVLRAIQLAGGATTLAAKSGVEVIRTMDDGSMKRIKVDLNKIGKEGKWQLDIKLEPDDVVFVPESIM